MTETKRNVFDLEAAWKQLSVDGWLGRLDSTTRHSLFRIARLRQFSNGQFLYRAGDKADGVYGLVRGELDIFIPRLDGLEYLFHRADPGFWIGDLAMFSGQKRLVSVLAVSECTALHLPNDKLRKLIDDQPTLMSQFYRLTYENFFTTFRLLGNLAVPDATQRIAIRLLMLAEGRDAGTWIELSRQSLAELVALSEQSVRRSIRRLEGLGLVESGYRKLRITDAEALAASCGYVARDRPAGNGARKQA